MKMIRECVNCKKSRGGALMFGAVKDILTNPICVKQAAHTLNLVMMIIKSSSFFNNIYVFKPLLPLIY